MEYREVRSATIPGKEQQSTAQTCSEAIQTLVATKYLEMKIKYDGVTLDVIVDRLDKSTMKWR